MSTIIVPDISEEAGKRVMTTYLRNRLPPYTPAAGMNPWPPLRDPWMHAFTPPDSRQQAGYKAAAEKLQTQLDQLTPDQADAAIAALEASGAPKQLTKLLRQKQTTAAARSLADTLGALTPAERALAIANARTPSSAQKLSAALSGAKAKAGAGAAAPTAKQAADAAAAAAAADAIKQATPAQMKAALDAIARAQKPKTPQEAATHAINQAKAAAAKAGYTIQDTGGIADASIYYTDPNVLLEPDQHRIARTPSPCYLTAVGYDYYADTTFNYRATLSIPEIGFNNMQRLVNNPGAVVQKASMLPLNMIAPQGATLRLDVENDGGIGPSTNVSLNAYLMYRNVSAPRLRPTTPAAAAGSQALVSPYIQLDPEIADAFDAAGMGLEWWMINAPGALL